MTEHFGAIVVGAGPAGQKAAICMAKAGRRVLLVDRTVRVGGACVRHGTVPSKTLREVAVTFDKLRRLTGRDIGSPLAEQTPLASLMARKDAVIDAHEGYMHAQLARNGVELRRAIASFEDKRTVELLDVHGGRTRVSADRYFLATGSSPKDPDDVCVDHQHILDSDSILSLTYLPRSLVVLGSGVIACEYASIFSALGVPVTMVHSYPSPLGFLDPDLVSCFLDGLSARGGTYLGNVRIDHAAWNGLYGVDVNLSDGNVLSADKVLCALGRSANVHGLGLERAGVKLSDRGHVRVDRYFRTSTPHIYAVGDVVGPPSLASTSMEQGRRAAQHALGVPVEHEISAVPTSIFTIPEISSVGLTEAQALEAHGVVRTGHANFAEVARGQISDNVSGHLKLVADSAGRLIGAQIAGEGASELVHVAQMAILGGLHVDTFVDEAMSFPTLAEAFRIAALDMLQSRELARAAE
ncbi:MAG TPA: Si-specific NAD(P)(+) transhydrogenase [Polyangiaceae bacterium]|mgnify:CR=1 FL=1|nr:Si-specific NAD(P)(+) transhydrogenase [Polyangiaceae bacterium]